jgi:hypothetical protein
MTKVMFAREELRRAIRAVNRAGRQYSDSRTGREQAWERDRTMEEANRALASDVVSWIRAMVKKLRRYR